MPGQFDVQDQSTFGGLFGETPGVARLTPETATEGMVFEGISGAATPKVLGLEGQLSSLSTMDSSREMKMNTVIQSKPKLNITKSICKSKTIKR